MGKINTNIAEAQANAFEPKKFSARAERFAYANIDLLKSNDADVIRKMNAFMGTR
jgi:hypothetical protein